LIKKNAHQLSSEHIDLRNWIARDFVCFRKKVGNALISAFNFVGLLISSWIDPIETDAKAWSNLPSPFRYGTYRKCLGLLMRSSTGVLRAGRTLFIQINPPLPHLLSDRFGWISAASMFAALCLHVG
jgi:hypothetical protein